MSTQNITVPPTKAHEWAREAAFSLLVPIFPHNTPSDIMIFAVAKLISNYHDLADDKSRIHELEARIVKMQSSSPQAGSR